MEEKLEELKKKSRLYKEKYSSKKYIYYPKCLRKAVVALLGTNEIMLSEFCRKANLAESSVKRWAKNFNTSSPIKKEPSSVKPISVKKEDKKQVCILKGFSFEELCELIGELCFFYLPTTEPLFTLRIKLLKCAI